MPFQTCPFCPSGLPWNACSCRWAIDAQRRSMMEAKRGFLAKGGVFVVPSAEPAPAKRPVGRPRTLLAREGDCDYCDRRRAAQAKANKTAAKRSPP